MLVKVLGSAAMLAFLRRTIEIVEH